MASSLRPPAPCASVKSSCQACARWYASMAFSGSPPIRKTATVSKSQRERCWKLAGEDLRCAASKYFERSNKSSA